MLLLEWMVPLLIGAVALTALARRFGVPYPVFLALGGAVLALMPSGPNFVLEPDLALALFVAPVLVDTAYDASIRDIRASWLPITLLVLAAVALSTIAVAVVARLMLPDLPIGAAVVLGAIVAPPDATAAMAILRQVRLPYRINVILEGESLLNDATALFIYRLGIGSIAVGAFHGGFLVASFILVLPLSLAIGVALAVFASRIIDRIDDPPSSIIVQFGFTFGLWMLADALQLSAVLTTVAYAVTISARGPRRFGARLRIPAFAVWETVTFMLNVLAFVLIGLQLRPILAGMASETLTFSLSFALVVLLVCLLARLAWVMGYQILRIQTVDRATHRTQPDSSIANMKAGLVVGWCGMRGIVTLAAAFALPDGRSGIPTFPHRDLMLLTAFGVVLGTLVLQGLTLRPLLRWADLQDDDPVGRETGLARAALMRAAVDELKTEDGMMARAVRYEYVNVLRHAAKHPQGFAPARTEADELRLRAINAARRRLYDLRSSREIGNEAFGRLEAELDQAEVHASPN